MSIRIDQKKCVGCGMCQNVCPGTLISIKNGKANMDYPRDCWGCASCVKECKFGAIEFFLGADIGGNGSSLSVTSEGNIMHWNIRKADGNVETIDIDRRNSNKY